MFKSKLMLPILAVIVGVAASAFTTPNQEKPFEDVDMWYEYTGTQDATARSQSSNYENPQLADFSCGGQINECAVQVTVTLDEDGQAPEHPDFTGASFTPVTGFPQPGSGLIKDNALKQ